MNRFPISNSTYVQISCVKYIPFLCQIWPQLMQKSSLLYQQSLGMIQTRIPIFLKSPYSLDDKIRTTVQLITYTGLFEPGLLTIRTGGRAGKFPVGETNRSQTATDVVMVIT